MTEKVPIYCAFVSNERYLTSDLVFFATALQANEHALQRTWSIQGKIDVREFKVERPPQEVEERLTSERGAKYGLFFFSLADLIATAPNFQIYEANPDAEDDPDQM